MNLTDQVRIIMETVGARLNQYEREMNALKKEIESLKTDVELLKKMLLERKEKPSAGLGECGRYIGSNPFEYKPYTWCSNGRMYECG